MFSKRKGISYFKLAGTNYKYLHTGKRYKKNPITCQSQVFGTTVLSLSFTTKTKHD